MIATGVNPTVQLSTGIHVISLEVTDADGLTAQDEVIISVIDPDNNNPIAVAGEDQLINDENGDDVVNVSFDGSNSSDSDGLIESYAWKANGEVFANEVTVTTPFSTGVYTIELIVTDDDGDIGKDQFILSVVDPDNDSTG